MSKNRGDGHWHPCRSWRRSWVLPSMILAAKLSRKVEWWSSEWLTLKSYSVGKKLLYLFHAVLDLHVEIWTGNNCLEILMTLLLFGFDMRDLYSFMLRYIILIMLLQKMPSSNKTTCWQQMILWLMASNLSTFGQLCSSLGTSETSKYARLQDDWKLTPIDYARTSGKDPPSPKEPRDDELLRRLKMETTRRWQRYNDT